MIDAVVNNDIGKDEEYDKEEGEAAQESSFSSGNPVFLNNKLIKSELFGFLTGGRKQWGKKRNIGQNSGKHK